MSLSLPAAKPRDEAEEGSDSVTAEAVTDSVDSIDASAGKGGGDPATPRSVTPDPVMPDPVMPDPVMPDPVMDDARPHDRELCTDHLLANIGRRSVRGGAIMFSAQAFKALAQFGSVVVLVRLLPPAAFGLIAMTAAIYALLDPIRDFGLTAATIQKPDLAHEEISTLFWVNASAGLALAAGLFLAAPLIAGFYHQPDLTAVTRWLALGLALNGLCSQHWALLRRQMRFGTVAALETSAELLSFGGAIALALAGAGYWALVVQRLIGPSLIAPGCWIFCRWRPSRPAFAPGAKGLLSFGGSMCATALMSLFARNVDQVAVGWFWGPISLGFYDRATKLLLSPLNNIMLPLYSIGFPALSRLSADDERYLRGFREILEKLSMVTMPGAATIALTADWTTAVVFGPKWSAAAPLVAWFALIAAFQPSLDTSGLLFLTHVRGREFLRFGFIDAGLRVVAIACSLSFGATAVAATLALSGLFVRAPIGFWLAARRSPVRLAQIYGTLLPSAGAALAVAAAVLVLHRVVLPAGLTPVEDLAVAVPTAVVVTLAVYGLVPQSRRALVGAWQRGKSLLGGS